jgi:hypothetical protein
MRILRYNIKYRYCPLSLANILFASRRTLLVYTYMHTYLYENDKSLLPFYPIAHAPSFLLHFISRSHIIMSLIAQVLIYCTWLRDELPPPTPKLAYSPMVTQLAGLKALLLLSGVLLSSGVFVCFCIMTWHFYVKWLECNIDVLVLGILSSGGYHLKMSPACNRAILYRKAYNARR